LITLRDKYSGEYIKGLGIKKVYYELADLAFLLKPEPIALPWKADKPILGFTPTNFVFENIKINGSSCPTDRVLEEITEYVKWLSTSKGFQVVFIPHVYGPEKKQDDRIVINQIVERLNSTKKCGTITSLLDKEYSAGELKYLIGQLDMLVACRTHSMIAALSQGIPVIALTDYRRYKTNGTLGDLFKLPECLYYVDDWNLNELKYLTSNLIDKRDEIKIKIESQISKVFSLAEKNIEMMKSLLL
jgi:polysaccharide pyruvyl transferase WcaK-like protein